VRELRGADPERVTVRMPLTGPGEVAEVDYAQLGVWVDLRTGKKVKVYAFVMTLCFSRMHFVDVVFGCDQRSWVASHVAAFEFFGGAPRQLRMDNLKTGVLRADIYDPQLNRWRRSSESACRTVAQPGDVRVRGTARVGAVMRPRRRGQDALCAGAGARLLPLWRECALHQDKRHAA
jgi:hypothetical protein